MSRLPFHTLQFVSELVLSVPFKAALFWSSIALSRLWFERPAFSCSACCTPCLCSTNCDNSKSCDQVENGVSDKVTCSENGERFLLPVSIITALRFTLSRYSTGWKCRKWSSTHQEGLFMVVMAALLNGCYGYLHTRYGVEPRLAVLLSLVRSPHFCLITDFFHWWRCKASPRSQWVEGGGGELC